MRLGGPGSFAQRRGLSGASAGGRAGVRPRESTRCHRHIMRRAAGRAFSRTQQRLGRVRAMKNLARPAKSECGMSERASERQPASQRDWEGMSHSLCVKQSTSLRAASAIPLSSLQESPSVSGVSGPAALVIARVGFFACGTGRGRAGGKSVRPAFLKLELDGDGGPRCYSCCRQTSISSRCDCRHCRRCCSRRMLRADLDLDDPCEPEAVGG